MQEIARQGIRHNLTGELTTVSLSVAPVSVHEALSREPLSHLGVDLPDLLAAVVAGRDLGHGVPPVLRLLKRHRLREDPPREVPVRVLLGHTGNLYRVLESRKG